MKFEIVDIVLGICAIILVIAYVFGQASWQEALTMVAIFIAKKMPDIGIKKLK